MSRRNIPTPDRQTLETDLQTGLYVPELSQKYGVSTSTMRRWLRIYEIYRPKVCRQRINYDLLLKAYKNGANNPALLAAAVGCSRRSARRVMVKFGLEQKQEKPKDVPNVLRCTVCGDYVDENDPIWGGKSGVHDTCKNRRKAICYEEEP
jgi:hypothetical protein